MTTFLNIISSRTMATAAITTAIAWRYNVPLWSLRSLGLAFGGLAVHCCINAVQNANARAAEASNLIKFFNKIPLEKPTLTGSQETQVAQIRAWMQEHAEALSRITSLNLKKQGLTAVPQEIRYFSSLRELVLSENQITGLANVIFPAFLQRLDLDHNQITSLADVTFPASLLALNLNNNQITSLADVTFPASLLALNLSNNQIISLANVTFPPSLLVLFLEYNRITSLANVTFPASLRVLYLSNNQIISLAHATFPASLQMLSLSFNRISSLANVTLPASLQRLFLNCNLLTNINPVLNLSFTCEISAEHNCFSAEYVASFQQALNARRLSNQGPRVNISIEDDLISFASVQSIDQLSAWVEEINVFSDIPKIGDLQPLRSLGEEEKLLLQEYLRKLRGIKDYRDGTEASKKTVLLNVARMLQLASTDQEFRKDMLAAMREGTETCGDRTQLTLNEIEILWRRYQKLNFSEAMELAVEGSCYEMAKKLATAVAEKLNLGDHIEVILYVLMNLREKLNLPITMQNMLYRDVGQISKTELDNIEATIKRIPDEELLAQSAFWLSYMKKIDPETIESIEKQFAELLSDAEEYDKISTTMAREQFLKSRASLAEIIGTNTTFSYKKVADKIMEKRAFAIAKVWRTSSITSVTSSASTSSASSQTARSM